MPKPNYVDTLKPLSLESLRSSDTIAISQYLLGKVLVSTIDDKITAGIIVEVEAYKAPQDKASHAYNNRRTARTKVMYEKGGISYIYLCYGLHQMFNVVTGPQGSPHAILIRSIEPIIGLSTIKARRSVKGNNLTNGPGKLSAALGINTSFNGIDITDKRSKIWIGEDVSYKCSDIISGPRVGIAYAKECAHWPWRFYLSDNKWVSKPLHVSYKQ
jgi:DNA-3-methyladenine glycosylase